ncbi:hypothetical protein BU24DRAFT_270846 [Aaosphaeria arxii CBS 175.79]|uniref:Uncharacterized protein n=1 Tax=Aaosphaeria arxii CBS 175.79 TaxID=1450172 RepID=A0A6A5XGD0_9PLEO|nr:uncharacterized protein BU24DRAFT_270846 [Aaosphaeria arxii CBS 175.79]KAF2012142.1 hypothetical protein BU24DRAFT_270846 [Aaosphaeria arxii CBS 175.79]
MDGMSLQPLCPPHSSKYPEEVTGEKKGTGSKRGRKHSLFGFFSPFCLVCCAFGADSYSQLRPQGHRGLNTGRTSCMEYDSIIVFWCNHVMISLARFAEEHMNENRHTVAIRGQRRRYLILTALCSMCQISRARCQEDNASDCCYSTSLHGLPRSIHTLHFRGYHRSSKVRVTVREQRNMKIPKRTARLDSLNGRYSD